MYMSVVIILCVSCHHSVCEYSSECIWILIKMYVGCPKSMYVVMLVYVYILPTYIWLSYECIHVVNMCMSTAIRLYVGSHKSVCQLSSDCTSDVIRVYVVCHQIVCEFSLESMSVVIILCVDCHQSVCGLS